MKKNQIAFVLVTVLFSPMLHAGIMDSWPFSFWTDRKLTPLAKNIKKTIVNCGNTSLDTKFDLVSFLEQQSPREVYEWVKILSINFQLTENRTLLQKVHQDTAGSNGWAYEERNAHYNKPAAINLFQGRINDLLAQRAPLQERLFYLPSLDLSNEQQNALAPTCADVIVKLIVKALPNVAAQASLSDPLPTDQIPAIAFLTRTLSKPQQDLIKGAISSYSVAQLLVLIDLWKLTSSGTNQNQQEALLQNLASLAYDLSPEGKNLQTAQQQFTEANQDLQSCYAGMAAHDMADCSAWESATANARAALDQAQKAHDAQKDSFEKTFLQGFSTKKEASFALPAAIADSLTRYLRAYYPAS